MNVTMTEAQLDAAARDAGARLPFPFQDSGVGEVSTVGDIGEAAEQIRPALTALASARLTVYAVVLHHLADSVLQVVAAATEAGSWSLEVAHRRATLCRVEQPDLVSTVVRAVAAFGAVTDEGLVARESVLPMRELTSPEGVAGVRPGRPTASGTLGVIDAAGDSPRHSRSVTWRLYPQGGLLAAEMPARPRRHEVVTVQAPSQRNLTRAALNLMTGLNHG